MVDTKSGLAKWCQKNDFVKRQICLSFSILKTGVTVLELNYLDMGTRPLWDGTSCKHVHLILFLPNFHFHKVYLYNVTTEAVGWNEIHTFKKTWELGKHVAGNRLK